VTDVVAATSVPGSEPAPPATGAGGVQRLLRATPYLGVLPFLGYVTLFLLWPTYIVITGAFQDENGAPTASNLTAVLGGGEYLDAFVRSILLSLATAVAGAILGALLAWAVAEGSPDGLLHRVVIAACGVLAQFGGVMLAFAFLATFGFSGVLTLFLADTLGVDLLGGGSWLYGLAGLVVVYTYFQIPLMLIVFLPALNGLRPQWREASENLGGTGWAYWRHVGGPLLLPSFTGATLLLFANAFSAYATAAALVSQGSPIVPLQIRATLTSEVILGQANVGKALALGMIVVIAVVMTAYALLQRRTSRWLR
jgi:putative spermidine/putrescine transport system permease protein